MTADLDECTLHLDSLGYNLDRWTQYTFRTDFLTPADSFTFSVGDPDIPLGASGRIAPGMKVSLQVNGKRICTGYIDEVAMGAERSSGTVFAVSGRDVLGDVVDSNIDPYMTFSADQSLIDVIGKVLAPYGLTTISLDNVADRSIRASNQFGAPKSKGGQSKPSKFERKVASANAAGGAEKITIDSTALKHSKKSAKPTSFAIHQAKPYPREGAYEFIGRLAKRAGLHIWAKADGTGVVIGKPDFSQEPIYNLIRLRGPGRGSGNNIISGAVRHARTDQPSVIIAGGRAGGGEFSRSTIRVVMVNELIGVNENGEYVDAVKAILKRFPKAYLITEKDFDDGLVPRARNPYPRARPMFLVDPESNNLQELINFTKREMASRQSRAIECTYIVAGHTYFGKPWAVDTTVIVSDDVANIHETMWIKGVMLNKSRSGGTTTTLTLIRPNTLRL